MLDLSLGLGPAGLEPQGVLSSRQAKHGKATTYLTLLTKSKLIILIFLFVVHFRYEGYRSF